MNFEGDMNRPVNSFIKEAAVPTPGIAERPGQIVPVPIDVEIEQIKIDLNHVAYYRNNSDYDSLLSALLSKVRGMQVLLSQKAQ